MAFNDDCYGLRKQIKQLGKDVLALKQHSVFQAEHDGIQDRGEMIANVMLAYRHVEDAAMRVGKAVQAFDGGVSIYDK